jgi:hypothetical protein
MTFPNRRMHRAAAIATASGVTLGSGQCARSHSSFPSGRDSGRLHFGATHILCSAGVGFWTPSQLSKRTYELRWWFAVSTQRWRKQSWAAHDGGPPVLSPQDGRQRGQQNRERKWTNLAQDAVAHSCVHGDEPAGFAKTAVLVCQGP